MAWPSGKYPNLSTQKAKTKRSRVLGQPELHSEPNKDGKALPVGVLLLCV